MNQNTIFIYSKISNIALSFHSIYNHNIQNTDLPNPHSVFYVHAEAGGWFS